MEVGSFVKVCSGSATGRIISKNNGWFSIENGLKKYRSKELELVQKSPKKSPVRSPKRATLRQRSHHRKMADVAEVAEIAKVAEIAAEVVKKSRPLQRLLSKTRGRPVENPEIKGLFYVPDAIDDISSEIDPEHFYRAGTSSNAREVVQYGRPFRYAGQKMEDIPIKPKFPEYLKDLRKIAIAYCEDLGLLPKDSEENLILFNQCIINKYRPGQKIGAHVDSLSYGKLVACFSIENGIAINFTLADGTSSVKREVYIDKNSLYIMSGPSRYKWTHEIRGRLNDVINGLRQARGTRTSITFRSNEDDTESLI